MAAQDEPLGERIKAKLRALDEAVERNDLEDPDGAAEREARLAEPAGIFELMIGSGSRALEFMLELVDRVEALEREVSQLKAGTKRKAPPPPPEEGGGGSTSPGAWPRPKV